MYIHESEYSLDERSLARWSRDDSYPQVWDTQTDPVSARFKQATLRLLDRLARDTLWPVKEEDHIRIVTMLDDIPDDRIPWLAHILVGSSDTDCNDKLSSKAIIKEMPPLPEGGHCCLDNR